MSAPSPCETYPCPPAAPTEPQFGLAIASLLVLLGAIALVTWAGAAKVPQPPLAAACAPAGRVTSAQIDAASATVRDAEVRALRTAQNGSAYAAAKIGLPASGPERDQAVAAAAGLEAVQADLAALCAGPG